MTLGQRVKALRLSKGYTITETAERAGLSRGYLHDIENDAYDLTVFKCAALARVLGITSGYLIGDEISDLSSNEQLLINAYRAGAVSYILEVVQQMVSKP